MKKAWFLIAFFGVLVLIGTLYLGFKGKRYELVITQQQIDTALEEACPVSKDFLILFRVEYSNPEVVLLAETNRVQVGLEATVGLKLDGQEKNLGGSVTLTSGIRYDNEEKAFYLQDAQFERFEVDGIA